jgi:hypothetical protein
LLSQSPDTVPTRRSTDLGYATRLSVPPRLATPGAVHIKGTVPSLNEKRVATNVANRIKGVVDVVDELAIALLTSQHTAARATTPVQAGQRAA